MANQTDQAQSKVTVREIQPGLYHVHDNPRSESDARKKFEEAVESPTPSEPTKKKERKT